MKRSFDDVTSVPSSLRLLPQLLRQDMVANQQHTDQEPGADRFTPMAPGADRTTPMALVGARDLYSDPPHLVAASARLFLHAGICVLESVLPAALIGNILVATQAVLQRIDEALEERGVSVEDDFSFNEVVRRGVGRYDVRFGAGMPLPADTALDHPLLRDAAPWLPVVRRVLGLNAQEIFRGVVDNRPGSTHQDYHMDGIPGERLEALTVFVPLVDIVPRVGPTEFFPGSHDSFRGALYANLEATDHLGQPQSAMPLPPRGSAILFDYRTIHRGTPFRDKDDEGEQQEDDRSCEKSASTPASRPMLYFVYARSDFVPADEKNFPCDVPLFS